MNILDLDDDKLRALIEHQRTVTAAMPPALQALVENLLELTLALREVRILAVESATQGKQIDPAVLIRLLDG